MLHSNVFARAHRQRPRPNGLAGRATAHSRPALPPDLSPEALLAGRSFGEGWAKGEAPSAKGGYIALLSILIVSAMAATTVLILFVTSITSTLNSADTFNGKLAKSLAEACMERALQSLTSCALICRDGNQASSACDDAPVPPTCSLATPYDIAFAPHKCQIVSILNTAGSSWRIRTTGIVRTVKKYMEVEATKMADTVAADVFSWKECIDFNGVPPCQTP